MRCFVMIPTYNESENIEKLIDEITSLSVPELHVVIVDDNSPDGTAEVVKKKMETVTNIHLLVRMKNKGRGRAGLEGFKYCVKAGADAVIEMDADFSHHPRHIPELIEKLEGHDIVIGSRFVKGGKNVRGGPIRNFITWFAGTYIRTMLDLHVEDPTSGYRCFKADVLRRINLESCISQGPSVVQEVLYKAHRLGFTMTEIPIVFEDRERGVSTFRPALAVQGFLMVIVFRLLFSKPPEPEDIRLFTSAEEK
ncbi:MAG: polyprenol monophosphomannose synthase [Vulcanimicrobiota bacterium]